VVVPIKYKIQVRAKAQIAMDLYHNRISKPDECSACGKQKALQAHHPDYRKQHDIIWLCRRCHSHIHYPYWKKNLIVRIQRKKRKVQKELDMLLEIEEDLRGLPTDEETAKQINDDYEYLNRRLFNRKLLHGRCHISMFFRP